MCVLILFCSGAVSAQPLEDADREVYERAYFYRYNPQTARDMVDRLPGFSLDAGPDLRGFGAGAGNVLIDGVRPVSKDADLEEILEGIPAKQVEQIEVVRGRARASETAGQSVVANIILAENIASGRWAVELQHPSDGRVSLLSEISYARSFGEWSTSTKFDASIERTPLSGTRISRDAAGALTLFQTEDSPRSLSSVSLASDAKRAAFGGALTLTGRLSYRPRKDNTLRFGFDARVPDDLPDQRVTLALDRATTNAELGVDWMHTISGDWSLKLLSLSGFESHRSDQTALTERPIDGPAAASLFSSDQNTFETVLRSTLSQVGGRKLRAEFGVEAAYNRLASGLSLLQQDSSGVAEIQLPAANVVVEEFRGEGFVNLTYAVSPRFTIEAGLAGEVSAISVSGDAVNTQHFRFAKPSLFATYDWRPGFQLRAGVERTVGQLNFTDFAASASAADDRLTAGNPALGPDQTTRTSLAVDLQSAQRLALNVEFFHEWRDDILEEIVLAPDSFGIGNAGSARVWGVDANASLQLAPLVPGGLVEIEAMFLGSSFDDPITQRRRTVSNTDTPSILVQFRQDLPQYQLSWGLSYRAPFAGTFFFANEESFNRDGEAWTAFVETTRFADLKTTFTLEGVGGQNFLRERRFFDPDRSGVITGFERISRDRGMTASLTLSKQF